MAVEMFRGPDHIASRVVIVVSWSLAQVCGRCIRQLAVTEVVRIPEPVD